MFCKICENTIALLFNATKILSTANQIYWKKVSWKKRPMVNMSFLYE
jgi:hypothetical protein